MALSQHVASGVAFCPVMDMSDQRLIAYLASPRPTPTDDLVGFVDQALSACGTLSNAPLLLPIDETLLLDPSFDPLKSAEALHCHKEDVVFLFPLSDTAKDAAERQSFEEALLGRAGRLSAAGYRIGLSDVAPLEVSWARLASLQPSFLILAPQPTERLNDAGWQAALSGLLAFAGRLSARLVVSGVASSSEAGILVSLGVIYGSGEAVHRPVVVDPVLADEGDEVVRPSWFSQRSVRALSAEEGNAVYGVTSAEVTELKGDEDLTSLVIDWVDELSSAEEPSAVVTRLAEILQQLVPSDRLAIFEADWDRYILRPRVLVGEELQSLTHLTVTLNSGITGWAFLRGLPYKCGRTADHPESAPIPLQEESDESLIVIPLVSGDRRLGVLDLWRDGSDRFSDADLARASMIGRLGADAWRRATERAELAERVVTDKVTALLNKRWWDELAPREAAQAARAGSTIAVLLVDLDNFKMVNDSYGHACGDAALKQAGRALSSAVRSGDAVVRYGGDEFILLLRDCGAADAVAVATDVQIALAAVRLSGRETPLTASIGIAMFPEHGDTLEDVVFRADQAMYVAKASGRNRISAYSADRETGTAVRAAAAGVFPRSLHSPESSSTTTQQALVAPPADGASSQPTQLRRHLEEERRRLEDLEQWAGVGSFEVDLDTGSVEWSAAMHRLLGSESDRAADEGLPVLPLARIAPEDRQALIAALTEWPDNEAVPAVHELIIHLLDTSDPFEGVDEASAGSAFSDAPRYLAALLRVSRQRMADGRRVLSGTLQPVGERPGERRDSLSSLS